MKTRKQSKLKTQNCWIILLTIILFVVSCLAVANARGQWTGVDESVVEKYAEAHGRPAREPFINTDQGDLLLFVFLLAGALGGFIAGYYWRLLIVDKSPKANGDIFRIL